MNIIEMKKQNYSDKRVAQYVLKALQDQGQRAVTSRNEDGSGGECIYCTDDGNMCAIGLVLPIPADYQEVEGPLSVLLVECTNNRNHTLELALRHYRTVLEALQSFHDVGNTLNVLDYVGEESQEALEELYSIIC